MSYCLGEFQDGVKPFASAEGRKKPHGDTLTPYTKSHRGVKNVDVIRNNFLHS